MCGCDWNHVCTRCRGIAQDDDWTLTFDPDPETVEERETAAAARLWMAQNAPVYGGKQ